MSELDPLTNSDFVDRRVAALGTRLSPEERGLLAHAFGNALTAPMIGLQGLLTNPRDVDEEVLRGALTGTKRACHLLKLLTRVSSALLVDCVYFWTGGYLNGRWNLCLPAADETVAACRVATARMGYHAVCGSTASGAPAAPPDGVMAKLRAAALRDVTGSAAAKLAEYEA